MGMDVAGILAVQVWGQQWIKVLCILYDGVTTDGLGGTLPKGKTTRMRVQLKIEHVMVAVTS